MSAEQGDPIWRPIGWRWYFRYPYAAAVCVATAWFAYLLQPKGEWAAWVVLVAGGLYALIVAHEALQLAFGLFVLWCAAEFFWIGWTPERGAILGVLVVGGALIASQHRINRELRAEIERLRPKPLFEAWPEPDEEFSEDEEIEEADEELKGRQERPQ